MATVTWAGTSPPCPPQRSWQPSPRGHRCAEPGTKRSQGAICSQAFVLRPDVGTRRPVTQWEHPQHTKRGAGQPYRPKGKVREKGQGFFPQVPFFYPSLKGGRGFPGSAGCTPARLWRSAHPALQTSRNVSPHPTNSTFLRLLILSKRN